jgi:uncharacterized protein (TIGR02265 family)
MAVDKLVFASAVEGLFMRALDGKVPPSLRTSLKALGLDLAVPVPAGGVPRGLWYAAIEETALKLYPARARGEAVRELGRLMVVGVVETFWGKAMTPAVRLLGVRRVLLRMPNQMKATNNFASGVATELTPTSMRLEVDDVATAPELLQGSLEQLALWAGAKSVEVGFTFTSPPKATYLVKWSEA